MTASTPTASRSPILGIAALAVLALVGVAIGAYLDWKWWHPTSGIVVTIGAVGLLLIGALAWASRSRLIRPLALGALALGIGAILGQNFGPSRPPITQATGRLNVELTTPANAEPFTGPADCQLTPDGEKFQISGDPNLPLQIGDQRLEQRDAVQISVARGRHVGVRRRGARRRLEPDRHGQWHRAVHRRSRAGHLVHGERR